MICPLESKVDICEYVNYTFITDAPRIKIIFQITNI
jgi:hypothetical protein